MTKLHFTRERPTEPGVYILQYLNDTLCFAKVYEYGSLPLMCDHQGYTTSIVSSVFDGSRWCGPLEIEVDA